eukprot:13521139-Alexandrium_andersonii.AAC.1
MFEETRQAVAIRACRKFVERHIFGRGEFEPPGCTGREPTRSAGPLPAPWRLGFAAPGSAPFQEFANC